TIFSSWIATTEHPPVSSPPPALVPVARQLATTRPPEDAVASTSKWRSGKTLSHCRMAAEAVSLPTRSPRADCLRVVHSTVHAACRTVEYRATSWLFQASNISRTIWVCTNSDTGVLRLGGGGEAAENGGVRGTRGASLAPRGRTA